MRNLFIALSGLMLVSCTGAVSSDTEAYDATYYLVRHAEKVLDVKDPPLTEEGQTRAEDLKARLSDVKLTHIYSSDYQRTRDTAAPTSSAQDIDITLYDPRDLPGIANILKAQSGNILVVGHSNTTPPLAELLSVNPGTPIVEATEYDRFYVIHRKGDVMSGSIETYGTKTQ